MKPGLLQPAIFDAEFSPGFSLGHPASGFVICPCVKLLSLSFATTPCSSNLIELAHYNFIGACSNTP